MLVLKEALTLFGIAVVIGIPTALGFTRLLRGLVYDVPVTDTATLVLATVALGMTACVAALIPARRAAGIDPAFAGQARLTPLAVTQIFTSSNQLTGWLRQLDALRRAA